MSLSFTNTQAKKTYLDRHPLGKDKDMLARLKLDIGFTNMGERYLDYFLTQSNALLHVSNNLRLVQPSPAAQKAALAEALAKKVRAQLG